MASQCSAKLVCLELYARTSSHTLVIWLLPLFAKGSRCFVFQLQSRTISWLPQSTLVSVNRSPPQLSQVPWSQQDRHATSPWLTRDATTSPPGSLPLHPSHHNPRFPLCAQHASPDSYRLRRQNTVDSSGLPSSIHRIIPHFTSIRTKPVLFSSATLIARR